MKIYADYAATAPMRACAKEAMLEALEDFGNPSSLHEAGRRAAERLNKARREMAELLNCRKDEIFFTSGGTESNNWALGAAAGGKAVASALEHPSILKPLEASLGGWAEQVRPESLPLGGAWIEILSWLGLPTIRRVAPLRGSVD